MPPSTCLGTMKIEEAMAPFFINDLREFVCVLFALFMMVYF